VPISRVKVKDCPKSTSSLAREFETIQRPASIEGRPAPLLVSISRTVPPDGYHERFERTKYLKRAFPWATVLHGDSFRDDSKETRRQSRLSLALLAACSSSRAAVISRDPAREYAAERSSSVAALRPLTISGTPRSEPRSPRPVLVHTIPLERPLLPPFSTPSDGTLSSTPAPWRLRTSRCSTSPRSTTVGSRTWTRTSS